jgi:uncharacterized YccA/Bax inhibitor family protein
METRNPVLSRTESFHGQTAGQYAAYEGSAAHLADIYAQPAAVRERAMTIDDVVVRTGILFVLLLATAVPTYMLDLSSAGYMIAMFGSLGLMVAIMVTSFKGKIVPGLYMAYALAQGVLVGALSAWYPQAFGNGGANVVLQAIAATVAVFVSMLVLYALRIIRATPRFTKMVFVGTLGLGMLYLINLIVSFFTPGGLGIFDGGTLSIVVCLVAIALASFNLVLDFDTVETGIRNKAPEKFAWLAAFGLLVTLVWLYLELLRLLSYLQSD